MNFSAVILAGGRSSRMGRDKAFLELDGRTLLRRQIETVQAAGAAEIFISGRADADYSAFGLRVVHDEFADAGPLGGIHAALLAASRQLLLVLAVDLPAMNAEFLNRLATVSGGGTGVIPRVSGRIEPLAAIYPRAALEFTGTMLNEHKFAVRDFAAACLQAGLAVPADFSGEDLHLFQNLNSPADLSCSN
jgi:molybdopterin-guanine dinucleotide biosynthesis protein A